MALDNVVKVGRIERLELLLNVSDNRDEVDIWFGLLKRSQYQE